MAQEIQEIKNLTDGTFIYVKGATVKDAAGKTKDKPMTMAITVTTGKDEFAELVEFTTTEPIVNFENKNIQVKWGTDQSNTAVRAASGTLKKGEGNKYSISGLVNYSNIVVSLQGVLKIGENSKVSVKLGNANAPQNDKIIDLSAGGETQIDLSELIAWNQQRTGIKAEIPTEVNAQNFILYVHQFHYNITQNTFNIDIRSGSGSKASSYKIADGFELTDLGFILTNEQNQKKPDIATKPLPLPVAENEQNKPQGNGGQNTTPVTGS